MFLINENQFIILLDTPSIFRLYGIIPPNTDLNNISHNSKLDPNTISVGDVFAKIKNFI